MWRADTRRQVPVRRSRKGKKKGKKRCEKAEVAVPAVPVAPRKEGPCAVCGKVTWIQCPCNTVWLCGVVCQKANWQSHKAECPARPPRRRKVKKKKDKGGK